MCNCKAKIKQKKGVKREEKERTFLSQLYSKAQDFWAGIQSQQFSDLLVSGPCYNEKYWGPQRAFLFVGSISISILEIKIDKLKIIFKSLKITLINLVHVNMIYFNEKVTILKQNN